MSDKQMVLEALHRLPDSASLEEIQEELSLLAAIRRGREAAEAGRVIDHETVRQRSASWTTPSSGPNQP